MKYLKTFGLSLLLFGLFGFLLNSAYVEVKNRTIDQLNSQQMILARQAAKSIEEFFGHYVQIMTSLAKMDHVIHMDEEGQDLLRAFYEAHAVDIKSIGRVDANGKIIYAYPPLPGGSKPDLSEQEHVQEIMRSHQPVVSDVFSSVQGFKGIALHVPVFEQEVYVGSLGALIPFDEIAKKYLKDIQIGEDSYAWMISQKGVELYCPVPGHVGRTVFENCKDFPTILAMAEEMLKGKQGTTWYVFDKIKAQSVTSVKKHAVYLPIHLPGTFWSIVIATPEAEAVATIQGFRNRLLLLTGVLLILAALLAYYFGRAFAVLKEETKRKQAENALQESEAKYRAIVEDQTELISRYLPDGTLTFVNQAYCRFFGESPEELVGRTFWHHVPEEDRRKFKEYLAGFSCDNPVRTIEHQVIDRRGEVRWQQWSDRAICNEAGQIVEFQAVGRDVTELRRAEEALRSSELFLKETQKIARLGGWRANPETDFLEWTDGVYDIIEAPRDYKPTLSEGLKFYLPEYVPILLENILECLKSGKPFTVQCQGITMKGNKLWVEVHGIESVVESGRSYVVGTFQDITERKAAEASKQKLEAELRHAQKMEAVGTLAGGIAHEFNNILGIILGNAELAADDIPAGSLARFNLDEIRAASLRAKDVVRQLLTFSRKPEENRWPVNLVPVVKEAIKFLRSSIPSSIEIRQNIPYKCHTVLVDPTQVYQILINLATNAVHAMEEQGGVLQFILHNLTVNEDSLASEQKLEPGDYVVLEVKDTGVGIPAEFRERIFDPYFTTKEVGKGTGMGLAVVHGIVQAHGGSIQVEENPEGGTTFRVFFPASKLEVETAEDAPEELPTGAERILFVDDEEPLAKLGALQLEKLGYQVVSVTDPKEALDLVSANPRQFDLLITDMTMPGITGDQLIREVLRLRSDMPAILCTGFSEKIDEEKARLIGARGYALKPLDRKDLATTVRKILDETS